MSRKFRTVDGSTSKKGLTRIHEWDLPGPISGTTLTRLLDIHIPHRGLVPPANLRCDADTILILPPEPGHQIAVALFGEPGTTDHSRWPGKETMDAMLVARATLLTTQLDEPVISITAVATYSAESRTAIQLSKAIVEAKGGSAPPPDLRAVTFATENLDGVVVPILTEMPVGT